MSSQADDPMAELREAALDLKALMNAADDQASAMTNAELGELLLTGRWTTIEIHEAGWRLKQRGAQLRDTR